MPEAAPTSTPVPGLPLLLTRLIGRDRDVQEIEQLLGAHRLLTLTGAGGSGKTRLAAEAASRLAGRFTHGAAWMDLAAISDPLLLPAHVLAALGCREETSSTATAKLVELLSKRSLLLVLDSCEHLVDACASLAGRLPPSAELRRDQRRRGSRLQESRQSGSACGGLRRRREHNLASAQCSIPGDPHLDDAFGERARGSESPALRVAGGAHQEVLADWQRDVA
jgi:hypothetical protein